MVNLFIPSLHQKRERERKMLEALTIVGLGLVALLGASGIVFSLERWTRTKALRALSLNGQAVFLFECGELMDASPAARRLLEGARRAESDLERLTSILTQGFGSDLGQRLEALTSASRLLLVSSSGAGTLEAVMAAGRLRLTLALDGLGVSAVDGLALEAAEAELMLLRGLAEAAPQPIWIVDGEGHVSWANPAYLALADRVRAPSDGFEGAELACAIWPLVPLFETPLEPTEDPCTQDRLSIVPMSGGEALWYDVTTVWRGDYSLHLATDVGDLVRTEAAREHFVQTLAATFAHLRTGLAIFDRDRRLVLFNPALLDLTGLPASFLSSRPRVRAVLDRLHEAKFLPDPLDHATWPEELAALDVAATEGEYCGTWTLPGGQTYRVTGRPHTEGSTLR